MFTFCKYLVIVELFKVTSLLKFSCNLHLKKKYFSYHSFTIITALRIVKLYCFELYNCFAVTFL